jgi:hypothetical protein
MIQWPYGPWQVAMELAWRAQRRRIGKDAKEGSDANQSRWGRFVSGVGWLPKEKTCLKK